MTKEEMLKQEAEEWLNKWELCNKCDHKVQCIEDNAMCPQVVERAYLAGAEPREKRISELEDKLANADYQLEGRDLEIKDLEKENAELKGLKDVATLIRANNDTVVTLMQLNNKLVSKSQQLTKAKEIIKQLLLLPYANNEEVFADVTSILDKAEQFLNEVEK